VACVSAYSCDELSFSLYHFFLELSLSRNYLQQARHLQHTRSTLKWCNECV